MNMTMKHIKHLTGVRYVLNYAFIWITAVTILSCIFLTYLYAGTTKTSSKSQHNFSIKYLGVTVATVELINNHENGKGYLSVHAQSTGTGRLLFPIDNRYYIEYREKYLPIIYIKEVNQRRFEMEKTAYFNLEQELVNIITAEQNRTIKAEFPEARDFFCSLLYLSAKINSLIQNNESPVNIADDQSIVVYANDNYWKGKYIYSHTENIDGVPAEAYRIKLKLLTNNEYFRSDVLTNNLIKDDNELLLWFSRQTRNLPVKAEFKETPFSVFWHLEDDEPKGFN